MDQSVTEILDQTELLHMKRNYQKAFFKRDSPLADVKSNLFINYEETPAKSSKLTHASSSRSLQTSKARSTTNASPELGQQLAEKDVEVISLKAKLVKLESKITSMETTAHQARIECDHEVTKMKAERDREASKAQDLRSKLQYVMSREKNAQEETKRLEKELQHQALEMDKKLLSEQRAKLETNDRFQQANAKWLSTESELRSQIFSQMQEIIELKNANEETQAQLDLRKKAKLDKSEMSKEIDELKEALQVEKKKNKDLEFKLSELDDNMVTTKALKADLDMVPVMKSELEKLRMDNEQLVYNEQNCMVLEEEIRGLKKKLEQMSTMQERLAELEVENEDLKGRLQRWEVEDTSGSRRPQSPSSLTRRIQELETSQANLMLSVGDTQSSAAISQRRLEEAESEKQKLAADLSAQKSTTSQLSDRVKRLERKVLLLAKERDMYKGLLDSYESEVTVNFDAEKESQNQRLEELIKSYKEQAVEAENKILKMADKITDLQIKYDQALQQIQILHKPTQTTSKESEETVRQLRERVAQLETDLLKTQEERDILDARIEQRQLQGDYDPSKTKIIHMTTNPIVLAQRRRQEELDRVKEENEKLRKRNAILEENGGAVSDITVQVEEKLQQPSPSKETEELKSQLLRQEMRNKRLMEVFKKTSQEFREVCYLLTGYKIDIQCQNQYRLTSMYAEREKDYLLFQQNEVGEMQLLQTDFSSTLQDAIEKYLQKQGSLPLFLSHITMSLFNQQTMLFE